jgi:glutathione S-transferase
MLTLYDYLPSGNGYKVRLLLHRLAIPFRLVELDIGRGETRTPEFLAKNPAGQIPLLEFGDGTYLAQSGAMIWYFAEDTELAPRNRMERAQTLQWMFFEQYSHEPNVAVARAWMHVAPGTLTEQQKADLPNRIARGYRALDAIEKHLAANRYFVGDRFGLADIALYAYTHVADEGGFDLARYPAIRGWIDRVAAEQRHVPITWRPEKMVA